MKSTLITGKKILSVFLAVVMVMTAWVFVAPNAGAVCAPGEHSFKRIVSDENLSKQATCIAPAVYFESCEICGEKSSETFANGDLDPTNHEITGRTTVPAQPASCLTNGWEEYEICQCGEIIGFVPIDQLLHDYSSTTSFESMNNGTHYAQCVNGCDTYGGAAIDCTYGAWSVEGLTYKRTCQYCSYVETALVIYADYTAYNNIRAMLQELHDRSVVTAEDKQTISAALAANTVASGLCEDTVNQQQYIINNAFAALEEVYTPLSEKYNSLYTVIFMNDNGTVLSIDEYSYGDTVTVPSIVPTKASDEIYSYTFSGWDKAVEAVTESTIYTAQYTGTYITYTVSFVNFDGTPVASKDDYIYNSEVVVPANPTRETDGIYNYEFAAWTPEVSQYVTKNTVYRATYNRTHINYTVSFVNYDNSPILSTSHHYGDIINLPKNPTKPSDETYRYVFAGWENIATGVVGVDRRVSGNVTYKAVYTPIFIEYTVNFVNDDGTLISGRTDYHYGDSVDVPANPTKAEDVVNTYTFSSWDSAITAVNGNKTYTAVYNAIPKSYTVKFVDYDGTPISEAAYGYGAPVVVPTDPTRAADETYTYEFSGWSPAVSNTVDGEAEYTATYIPTYIEYNVEFIIIKEDGSTKKIRNAAKHYGEAIDEPEDVPDYYNISSDTDNHYTFTGKWTVNGVETPVASTITESVTYVAAYETTPHDYTDHYAKIIGTDNHRAFCVCGKFTVEECNGSGADCTGVATCSKCTGGYGNPLGHIYGEPVWTWADDFSSATATFTCENDPSHTYEIVTTHTNNMLRPTVMATPTCTETGLITHLATVRHDGVIYRDKKNEVTAMVPHRTIHTDAVDPTCTSDGIIENWFCEKCRTIFGDEDCTIVLASAVDPMIPHVFTGDIVYIGEDKHTNLCSYGCGTRDIENAVSCTYSNWTLTRATASEDAFYTKNCTVCTHEETVAATKADYSLYNIQMTFLNSLLENDRVTAEDKAMIAELIADNTVADNLVADTDDLNKGKLNEQSTIDAAVITLKPSIDSLSDKYLSDYVIEFVDYNGETISKNIYRFGDEIIVPADPTRESDVEFDYSFSGWDNPVPTYVTENATYTATYAATYIEYTVEFIGHNGLIVSKDYHYGDVLVMPTEEELATASYVEKGFTYLVIGWTNTVEGVVVKNNTYTAVYNKPFDLTRATKDIAKATNEAQRTHYEHEKLILIDEKLEQLDELFAEYGIDLENKLNPVDSTNVEFATRLGDILTTLEGLLNKLDCTGHKYVVTVTEATCLAMGYTKSVCSKCRDEIYSDWTEIIPHDYKAVIYEPTCTEKGYTTHTCTMCMSSYKDSYVDCLPHDFVSILTEPTCTEEGYTTNKCKVCNTVVITDRTSMIPHDYNAVVTEPTCQHGGYTAHTCSMCGDEYYDTFTEVTAHNYVGFLTEPTCTAGGYTTYKCSYCGDSYVADQTAANGHSWVSFAEAAATCGVSGHSAYDKCTVCNERSGYVEYPALKHSFMVTVESTAADGSYSWRTYTCQTCGAKFAVITLIARDEKNRSVANAKVTILDSNNNVICSSKTDNNGNCTPNIDLYDGTYTVIVENTAKQLKAEGSLTVSNGVVSGNFGKLHYYGEPVIEEEDCTCNCHKTGFANLTWKFTNFFRKLFRIEKYRKCACGKDHWE